MIKTLSQALGTAAAKPSASMSSWLGKSIRLSDGGFWSAFLGAQSSSGKAVTVDKAMRLSAVWACVRIISTSVAGLPLSIYRRLPDGGRETARDFPLYDVVHNSPNEDMAAFHFWQAVVASMLLWGNAYCEIHRSGGRVIALDFLMPSRVTPEPDDDGRLRYFFQPRKGARREIAQADMLHIPAFTLDGRMGLSAIRYGADVFGSAMSADDAANTTFKNGMMPTVAFSVDKTLNPTQRAEFRDYVKTISGALNAGKSPVLEQGVKPEMIGINPADAQLLESRGHSIEEICRWFGVPPWMVMKTDKGSNWGTGLEQQQIAFLTYCIMTYTAPIEQCVNKRCLTAVDRIKHYAEFSLEAFLRADSAGRAAYLSTMGQNGYMTRNEGRHKENLPSMPGGDILTVQSNLVPLDQLGKQNDSQAARAALMNWLQSNSGE
ncbi:phage portal protein [Pseudomonas fulva]|uniref:phage portal protein n=1 Tax=Pseudomonas TaxID=286 RepID=UPI0019CFFB66|nr:MULTISPECIES: phage portal protein [Pseudomonas]MCY4123692.1 phage portal protein [Pseudomonas sp.]MBN6791496.1 phage portal protein [Pseudomonas fulva]MBN6795687.1 phage portal protein [Pseudomonas fulva]MBN6857249.1 phage portal protein [Pseudomonas fulva]MBN6874040.1 phage portal protein [Pseudomonas fulva]